MVNLKSLLYQVHPQIAKYKISLQKISNSVQLSRSKVINNFAKNDSAHQ